MFSPIEVAIRPSVTLRWIGGLSHLGVVVLVVQSALPIFAIAGLLVLGVVSFLAGRRPGSDSIRAIRWDADLRSVALYQSGPDWLQVDALESVLVWPWLLVLRFRRDGQCFRLVLVRDSLSESAFRRLSVIARLAPLQLNEPDQATHN